MSPSNSIVKMFIMPILQIEKIRHRKVKKLAWDHLTYKHLIQDLNSGLVKSVLYLPQCCLFYIRLKNMPEKNNVSDFDFLIIYDFSLCEIIFCIFKHGLCLGGKNPVITLFPILPFINVITVSIAKTLLKYEETYSMIMASIHSFIRCDHRVLAMSSAWGVLAPVVTEILGYWRR